jgi:hypothetical protein
MSDPRPERSHNQSDGDTRRNHARNRGNAMTARERALLRRALAEITVELAELSERVEQIAGSVSPDGPAPQARPTWNSNGAGAPGSPEVDQPGS